MFKMFNLMLKLKYIYILFSHKLFIARDVNPGFCDSCRVRCNSDRKCRYFFVTTPYAICTACALL